MTAMVDSSPGGGAAAVVAGMVIRGLRKRYGDTRALDGLDMEARPGEILGVAGPNGAGKSTVIKILAGEVAEDAGEIRLDGVEWRPMRHRDRVAVVHQEPQLFPNLSVAENIMIGREGTRALVRDLTAAERSLMADLAILEYASRPLSSVPLAIRQRVEIGRALARDARIFLFDEPNSALTPEESTDLFRRMHLLADAGRVVLLVSHRIAELADHAHRVALLLDGRCTTVLEGSAVTQEGIAAGLVTGQAEREPAKQVAVRAGEEAATALQLSDWTHGAGDFSGIELRVRSGEIVAIVGVEGSGARELVRSIAGFEHGTGQIEIAGQAVGSAIASRSCLVSADRQGSLFPNLTIGDNLVSRLGSEITSGGFALRRGRMSEIANDLRERFSVKAASVGLPINALSGGNQQKVAIAAAIVKRPEALVLEEPTRGVDISSKRDIYKLLRGYADEGTAVIIFCTEVPEVFDVADRAYVMSDGHLSGALQVADYTDVETLAHAITRLERHSRQPLPASA